MCISSGALCWASTCSSRHATYARAAPSSIADVRIVDEQGNVRLTATVTMHIVRDIQPEDVGVQQKLE